MKSSRIARWPASAIGDRVEVINPGIGGESAAQSERINDLEAGTFMNDAARCTIVQLTLKTLLNLEKETAASEGQVLLTTIIPAARSEILRVPV